MQKLKQMRAMLSAVSVTLLAVAALSPWTANAQTCPFDNGGSTLENDGLVLTRYALGLRGATMVANTSFAVGDAATIESNIACPACGLSVTGDTAFSVADATIISRKLAGFSGTALTNGVALGSGTRNTPAAVQSFLLAGCGTASNGWVQGGNAFGAPGVIGTTDGQPLMVGTGLGDGLRISRSNTAGSFGYKRSVNVVNGSRDNFINASAQSATIAGGGGVLDLGQSSEQLQPNSALSDGSTVGGGLGNTAGTSNSSSSGAETVSGGLRNSATSNGATVSGGEFNRATNTYSAVLGGNNNQATGYASAVLGGYQNVAAGNGSAVLGVAGTATDAGQFVWNSGVNAWNPKSAGLWGGDTSNTFNVRADRGIYLQAGSGSPGTTACTLGAGGTGWGCTSDRAMKDRIVSVSPRVVLEKVAKLPVSTWVLKGYEQLHMGPMAQDFREAFGLGRDDKTINTTDAQGVALAAIQGLNQKLTEQIKVKDREIAKLKAKFETDIAAIKKKVGM